MKTFVAMAKHGPNAGSLVCLVPLYPISMQNKVDSLHGYSITLSAQKMEPLAYVLDSGNFTQLIGLVVEKYVEILGEL